jgi:hypothetical protein
MKLAVTGEGLFIHASLPLQVFKKRTPLQGVITCNLWVGSN